MVCGTNDCSRSTDSRAVTLFQPAVTTNWPGTSYYCDADAALIPPISCSRLPISDPHMQRSPRGRAVVCLTAAPLLALLAFSTSLAAQSTSQVDSRTFGERFQFTARVGVAHGLTGFDHQSVTESGGVTSHYRVSTSPAWGAALLYAHNAQLGLRADLDAVGPVRISEVSRRAAVQGQSVAWLGGISLAYTPAALCRSACFTLSAGPATGFYELAQHMEVARRSFAVSKTQLAFAARAGLEIRASGRFQPLTFSVSNYAVDFSPVKGSPEMTTLNHLVVSLGWTPP